MEYTAARCSPDLLQLMEYTAARCSPDLLQLTEYIAAKGSPDLPQLTEYTAAEGSPDLLQLKVDLTYCSLWNILQPEVVLTGSLNTANWTAAQQVLPECSPRERQYPDKHTQRVYAK